MLSLEQLNPGIPEGEIALNFLDTSKAKNPITFIKSCSRAEFL